MALYLGGTSRLPVRGRCGLWRRRERRVEAISSGTVAAGHKVPLVIYGDLDAVVAELVANVCERLAVRDVERSKGVTKRF